MHKPILFFTTTRSEMAIEEFSRIVKKYNLKRDTNQVYSNDTFRAEIMKEENEFIVILEKWIDILDYETEKFTAALRVQHYAKNNYPDLEISKNQLN